MISKLIFNADLPTWALFLELAIAALIVIWTGARFTRLADTLAERLNLGAGWIGLILLATVTSLPEVITGVTATWIGNVDLALGGILGSCSCNLTLIVLLNALMRSGSVLRGASLGHTLSSTFGLLLLGLALMGMVLIEKFSPQARLAQVGELLWAAVILVTYLGCMRLSYRFERQRHVETFAAAAQPVEGNLNVRLAVLAVILVMASWWLARSGDVLSDHEIEWLGRPLGATFVGACFLAVATSLPEISTSVAAVRLGNLELALGNIFGSNMFNIFVIPMLKGVSLIRGDALMLQPGAVNTQQNLIAGLLAILLSTIAIGGLTYQSRRKMLGHFGFDSILIAVTYVGGLLLLLAKPGL